jgi:DNA-binding NtrC family response regulator
MPRSTLLVIDDEPNILTTVRRALELEDYRVEVAGTGAIGLQKLDECDIDLVLLDVVMPELDGLEVLRRIRAAHPDVFVIMMSGNATIETAVQATKGGALDFIEKPLSSDKLLLTVQNALSYAKLARENASLRARAQAEFAMIGASPSMRAIFDKIAKTAPTSGRVLITGENGTGKGLVAQAIHALSPRAARPMVTVNAGGVSETVFESELFGHVRGAFTDARADRVGRFELADGGTLFLDEIANVPPSQQAKLLRVIAAGEFERLGSSRTRRVDVRILSATNAQIDAEVAAGRFRQDLLFRLNTIEIVLPALRDRRDDIPSLATHFLEQHARRYRKPLSGFDSAAMDALLRHPWPGNVRELEHAIERAVLMAAGPTVAAGDLGLRRAQDGAQSLENMSLEDVEAFLIRKAIGRYGSVTDAAKALGLSRSALYRRLERYGIEP